MITAGYEHHCCTGVPCWDCGRPWEPRLGDDFAAHEDVWRLAWTKDVPDVRWHATEGAVGVCWYHRENVSSYKSACPGAAKRYILCRACFASRLGRPLEDGDLIASGGDSAIVQASLAPMGALLAETRHALLGVAMRRRPTLHDIPEVMTHAASRQGLRFTEMVVSLFPTRFALGDGLLWWELNSWSAYRRLHPAPFWPLGLATNLPFAGLARVHSVQVNRLVVEGLDGSDGGDVSTKLRAPPKGDLLELRMPLVYHDDTVQVNGTWEWAREEKPTLRQRPGAEADGEAFRLRIDFVGLGMVKILQAVADE